MIQLRKNAYGGPGPFSVPADHVPAIRVPKGGSCCKNCMFVDAKNHACKEPHYIAWNGSPKLPPFPLDEICSDWYDWPGARESERAHNPVWREHQYYIWTCNQRGEVVGQWVAGPYPQSRAIVMAASDARHGGLDRAVSFGHDPKEKDFKIVRAYRARTGKRIV